MRSPVGQAFIAHGKVAHVMGARLRKHIAYARVHRQADDLQLVGMLPNHVDRLRPDGARGAENNDAFHESLRSSANTTRANAQERWLVRFTS